MSFFRFFFIFLLAARVIFAQNAVYRDTIPVFESNARLSMPWAGGINFSSFTQIDLNLDGKKDIVAFDKICSSGGRLRTFLNAGSIGEAKYVHDYNHQNQFPEVKEWALFFDYNNDGWQDIYIANDRFTTSNILYKNNGNVFLHPHYTIY